MIPLFDREILLLERPQLKEIKKIKKQVEANPGNNDLKKELKEKEKKLQEDRDIRKAKKKLEKEILKNARRDSK